jgi:hypothetical protein
MIRSAAHLEWLARLAAGRAAADRAGPLQVAAAMAQATQAIRRFAQTYAAHQRRLAKALADTERRRLERVAADRRKP